jgi:hypothetical protein
VAVVSIIRLIRIVQSNPETHADFTLSLVDGNVWTSTELTIGLLCVCAPASGYLFRTIIKKMPISSSWKESSDRSNGPSRLQPPSKRLSRVQPGGRDASWRTLADDDSMDHQTLKTKDSQRTSDSLDEIEMSTPGIHRTQTATIGASRV